MKAHFQDRLAGALSMLLLVALAGGTYYLAQVSMQMAAAPNGAELRHEPDYFVDKLVFTRINALGEPAYRLSADQMFHFPDDLSTDYKHPVLVSLDPGQPRTTIVADTGTSTSEGIETRLHGNVVISRAAAPGDPAMTIRTDYVVLFSQTEIAKTDRPVVIEHGKSTLTGVGMEFNNAARSLIVDSQARGTWVPEPKTR